MSNEYIYITFYQLLVYVVPKWRSVTKTHYAQIVALVAMHALARMDTLEMGKCAQVINYLLIHCSTF